MADLARTLHSLATRLRCARARQPRTRRRRGPAPPALTRGPYRSPSRAARASPVVNIARSSPHPPDSSRITGSAHSPATPVNDASGYAASPATPCGKAPCRGRCPAGAPAPGALDMASPGATYAYLQVRHLTGNRDGTMSRPGLSDSRLCNASIPASPGTGHAKRASPRRISGLTFIRLPAMTVLIEWPRAQNRTIGARTRALPAPLGCSSYSASLLARVRSLRSFRLSCAPAWRSRDV